MHSTFEAEETAVEYSSLVIAPLQKCNEATTIDEIAYAIQYSARTGSNVSSKSSIKLPGQAGLLWVEVKVVLADVDDKSQAHHQEDP